MCEVSSGFTFVCWKGNGLSYEVFSVNLCNTGFACIICGDFFDRNEQKIRYT